MTRRCGGAGAAGSRGRLRPAARERESRRGIADRLAHLDRRLDGRAQGDNFVDVDAGARRLAGHLRDIAPHHRHPRRAADQEHAVELRPGEPGLAECFLGEPASAVHEREGHRLEFGPRQLERAPFGAELKRDSRR